MRRGLVAIGGAAVLVACAQIWGFDDLRPGDAGPMPMDGGMGDATCGTQWPLPPAADDPNGRLDAGGDNGFIVVVNALNVLKDRDGGAAKFGYDLDCMLTTGANNSSCAVPSRAVSNIADLGGGVDNNGAPALNSLAALGTVIKDQLFNDPIQKGEASVMMRLYDYNGADDDTNVTFGVLGTTGTVPLYPDGGHPPPNLIDGGDKWQIEIADTIQPSYYGPKTRATKAWVTKRTLVAIFDNTLTISIPTPYGKIRVSVEGAVLSAKLVPAPDDTITMEGGVIVGRWKTANLFNSVGNLSISGQPLCGAVHSLADGICSYVDVASNKLGDGKGKPCDALSVALEFSAVPGIPSGTTDGGAYIDTCEAGDCPK